jgi:hypothetical protein
MCLRKTDISAGTIPGVMGRIASNGQGGDIQKVMVLRKKEKLSTLKCTVNLAIPSG